MKSAAAIIGLLIVALGSARAAEEPDVVARSFLEGVRGAGSTLEEVLGGTALSPFCGEEKRKWIEGRLRELRQKLRGERPELAVLDTKRADNYAGVLIAVRPEDDPYGLTVLTVGLKRVGDEWKVAPVLGTFENTNVGFDPAVRKQVEGLEQWMAGQRVLREADLQAEAFAGLKKDLEKAGLLLAEDRVKEVVARLLKACGEGDLAVALACLGVGAENLSDQDGKLRMISLGLGGNASSGQWRWLTSRDVVQLVADERREGKETLVQVLFYDGASSGGATMMEFAARKVSGRWVVTLPWEYQGGRGPWAFDGLRGGRRAGGLKEKFAQFFEAEHPVEYPQTARGMGERIDAVLRDGNLADFFKLLSRDATFAEGERRVTYAEAAQFWREFHKRGRDATHGELVEVMEEGTAALVVMHLVTTARLDRMELVTLLLVHREDGWSIAPGVVAPGNWETMPPRESVDQKQIMMKFARRKTELQQKVAESFLAEFVVVNSDFKKPVAKEAAAELVRTFREHLRNGEIPRAIACCALLDRPKGGWDGLKSLGYEYRGARKSDGQDQELSIQSEGHWAAVSLRLGMEASDLPDYPLYLVRASSAGPRIVMDAGLRYATNKGRELLNGHNLDYMAMHLAEDELELVKKLFAVHCERSKTDHLKWETNNK